MIAVKDGFVRVAAATPQVSVANVEENARRVGEMVRQAAEAGCGAVCFPELALTGYTCGDLFRDRALLSGAERALASLLEETAGLDILCAVGVPVPWNGALYNCAAVFHKGRLLGLPAKSCIPNYSEFYEARHFTPAPAPVEVPYAGQRAPLGRGLLFCCENVPDLVVGVEICEDLWSPAPPSTSLAQNGATVVLNPSCSDETIGKAEYRRELVRQHSGRLLCAYVYTDSGLGESTTDMVFAGHDLIAENGALLGESQLFTTGLVTADVDLERLSQERRRMNTWQPAFGRDVVRVPFRYQASTLEAFQPQRDFARTPFVPQDAAGLSDRCQLILTMQSVGLASRLSAIHGKVAVVGLSGGLDSTLALLVTVRAFDRLGLDRKGIHALSMPCFGTTSRTMSNAQRIAQELGVSFREVSIEKAVRQHFLDIGQEETSLDVTFENSQARERTQVLMDTANRLGGIVIGTGDLSELALGWATYNGDHMSMYGVNASIPKTLVRHLVRYVADHSEPRLQGALLDVLDTPVSPELLPHQGRGNRPKDRGAGGALRAPRLFPVLYAAVRLCPGEDLPHGLPGLCRGVRRPHGEEMAFHLLPAVLHPAV